MSGFFTEAFERMSPEDRESFCKTVFMNDTSDYAKELRQQYYAGVLKHMGEDVQIGTGVKIVNPQYISLGDHVRIADHVTLIARGPGGITLEDNVRLNDRVYLDTENAITGYIHVGKRTYIGTGATFFGHQGLEFGEDCLIGQNVTCTPYSHIFDDKSRTIYGQGGHCKKVTIGRDVYVGMGVTIMYTGDIGEGSVIGAGAVVVKPIPEYSIAVGNPARVIRKRGE